MVQQLYGLILDALYEMPIGLLNGIDLIRPLNEDPLNGIEILMDNGDKYVMTCTKMEEKNG